MKNRNTRKFLFSEKIVTTNLRIAIVASEYSNDTSSGENIFLEQFVSLLTKSNLKIAIFLVKTDNEKNKFGYKIKKFFGILTGTGSNPREFLDEFRPDIIIVHNLFPNIGMNWIKKRQEPILMFLHNYRLFCNSGTFFREGKECYLCIEKDRRYSVLHKCYRNSMLPNVPMAVSGYIRDGRFSDYFGNAKFICLNPISQEIFIKCGIEKSRITVLKNFLNDIDRNQILNPKKSLNFKYLYSGRITEEKGIFDLIKCWPEELTLDVIGKPPDKYVIDSYPNINFHGQLNNKELIDQLRKYDVAIFPSKWSEGYPIAVIEYMRAGLPILAKKGNTVANDVEFGKAGLTFEKFDPDVLKIGRAHV
mgnify:CR=1 FL=1